MNWASLLQDFLRSGFFSLEKKSFVTRVCSDCKRDPMMLMDAKHFLPAGTENPFRHHRHHHHLFMDAKGQTRARLLLKWKAL